MIDLISSKRKKKAIGFEHLKPAASNVAVDETVKLTAPKVARVITDRITQRRSSIVPPISGSTLRHHLELSLA